MMLFQFSFVLSRGYVKLALFNCAGWQIVTMFSAEIRSCFKYNMRFNS